jgi:hypothetical protein
MLKVTTGGAPGGASVSDVSDDMVMARGVGGVVRGSVAVQTVAGCVSRRIAVRKCSVRVVVVGGGDGGVELVVAGEEEEVGKGFVEGGCGGVSVKVRGRRWRSGCLGRKRCVVVWKGRLGRRKESVPADW